MEASKKLEEIEIKLRVISFPSIELFEMQDEKYKKNIIGTKPCFAVEAGVVNGWDKYVKHENFIGMSSFGSSAPYKDLYKYFGINSDHIFEKVKKELGL